MTSVIAHRGCAAEYPENTLAAVRSARNRVAGVEIDVRRCGSGELVVIHEPTVDRVTDGNGRVSEIAFDELRGLDVLDSGETIPTLDEVLAAIGTETTLHLEIKEPDITSAVVDSLSTFDGEAVISSFDETVLSTVEAASSYRTALIFGENPGANLERATELGCWAIHPHFSICSTSLVRDGHELGMRVNPWTITDRTTAERMASRGVDAIISDRCDVLSSDRG